MTEDPTAAERATKLRQSRLALLVTVACLFALVGLGVTIIHFLWPIPLLFALFMTVGQGSFALAMVLYLVAILGDLKRRGVL